MPDSMRMVEPEFPQSKASEGGLSCGPNPSITTLPSSPRSTAQPSLRTHSSVLAQSAPARSSQTASCPGASAASIA